MNPEERAWRQLSGRISRLLGPPPSNMEEAWEAYLQEADAEPLDEAVVERLTAAVAQGRAAAAAWGVPVEQSADPEQWLRAAWAAAGWWLEENSRRGQPGFSGNWRTDELILPPEAHWHAQTEAYGRTGVGCSFDSLGSEVQQRAAALQRSRRVSWEPRTAVDRIETTTIDAGWTPDTVDGPDEVFAVWSRSGGVRLAAPSLAGAEVVWMTDTGYADYDAEAAWDEHRGN